MLDFIKILAMNIRILLIIIIIITIIIVIIIMSLKSLFHQKIKLHILCYNNTEDKDYDKNIYIYIYDDH